MKLHLLLSLLVISSWPWIHASKLNRAVIRDGGVPCTMCASCDNPCGQPSPPPPAIVGNCPPPPSSQQTPSILYYSPPPPPANAYTYPSPPYFNPPQSGSLYPTPPPPNPFLPYFPFYYYSPPPPHYSRSVLLKPRLSALVVVLLGILAL